MFLRMQAQREAEGMLALAKSLVEARGESLDIAGHKSLQIDHLTIVANYGETSNTLSIHSNGESVMLACWDNGDAPPFFVTYQPSAWRWSLRRATMTDDERVRRL